jgi:hypothetical protein
MTKSPGQGLQSLHEAVQQAVQKLEFSKPEFELTVGWAATYDDLFAGRTEKTVETAVLERTLRIGRCVVAGRGGGGKTQMLHRIMRTASTKGVICVLVDLKDWTKHDYQSWDEWTTSDIGAGASFLLERFAQPKVDAMSLDYLPPTAKKLLIVDGLNEIMAPVGQAILFALDEFAGDQIGLSVLVADRLTRRSFPSPTRWALASVLPLAPDVVAKHYQGPNSENLSTPYFLDAAISKKSVGETPSQTHRRFLVNHGGLVENELTTLAAAAYGLYSETGTRTFPFAALVAKVGQDLASRLTQTGVIVKAAHADDSQFAHHLLHDYLSARAVAELPQEDWTPAVLRTISFDGSSFDTISMVLAQLKREEADKFLRCLYDWNLYAAAYALADLTDESAGPSREMRQVIFAMLAEKRFDLVTPTRQRAADALAIAQTESATKIRASDSMSSLFAALRSVNSKEDWFNEWVHLFTSAPDKRIDDKDLERIQNEDSILGWTVANVARRMRLEDAQAKRLRVWIANGSPVVRWRIAHVLGAHPSTKNMQTLSDLLKGDKDADVRYGAVRSMVETAARTSNSDLRSSVVSVLVDLTPILVADKKVKEELKRALQIEPRQAPQDWSNFIARIARSLYLAESAPDEREAWRRYVDLIQARYPNG